MIGVESIPIETTNKILFSGTGFSILPSVTGLFLLLPWSFLVVVVCVLIRKNSHTKRTEKVHKKTKDIVVPCRDCHKCLGVVFSIRFWSITFDWVLSSCNLLNPKTGTYWWMIVPLVSGGEVLKSLLVATCRLLI